MEEEFLKQEEKEFTRFYRLSGWWVDHRGQVKKVAIGVFIFIDALLLLFVLWTFTDTYLISYNQERLAVAELAVRGVDDLHGYTESRAADSLRIGSAGVIALGDSRYDIFGTIENPNTHWYAEVTYRFRTNQGETKEAQTVILPNEKKPVAVFGEELDAVPRQPILEIMDFTWIRVDAHLVGNYDEWLARRFNFEVTDVSFGTDIELEGEDPIGRVSFTVKNNAAYSYYDPSFFIRLLRGNTIVGVTKTTLSEIDTGESINVEVNWFGRIPDASKVEVIPDINVFDLTVYKPLEATTPSDRRDDVGRRR